MEAPFVAVKFSTGLPLIVQARVQTIFKKNTDFP